MTTPREHMTPYDFVCGCCDGSGEERPGRRCHPCNGTGMDLELLAELYNGLSAAVREVQAKTVDDE